MKKLFSVILSLIFALFVVSCDKETESVNGNDKGNGTFSLKTKEVLVTGISGNFKDINTTKSQTDIVSKTYQRIDNEYVLEAEVVAVPEVQTKSTTSIKKAKCYTMYSDKTQPIKEQVLDFTNGTTAKLQIPVDDKNFQMLVFADINNINNFPISNNRKINVVNAKSGNNMCSNVYKANYFNPGKVTFTLTPLFSQIKVAVNSTTEGSNETVTLNSAKLKAGGQSTADVTLLDNALYNKTNTDEEKTLDVKNYNDFIPNNNTMSLEVVLSISGTQKTFPVSLGKVAQSGYRYLVNLKVKKTAGGEHSIFLLSEHGDEDWDYIKEFGNEGVFETTNPENMPRPIDDPNYTGNKIDWDTSKGYCIQDLGTDVYKITMTIGHGGYLRWTLDPSVTPESKALTEGKWICGEAANTLPSSNVYYRRAGKTGLYDIYIKKSDATNGKKFVFRIN